MTDNNKSKQQLIEEAAALRRQVAELQAECLSAKQARQQAEQALHESEERLQAFARAMPDLAFVLDEKGQYVEILTGQENLLYANADRLQGRTFHDVLPQAEADLFLATVRRTIETEKPQILEYVLDVPAGRRWFEGRTSPMYRATGQTRMVVWVSRDITEHKRAEAALQENEAKFRMLAEMSTTSTFIYQGARFRYVNPAMEAEIGYTRAELMAMNFWDIIHPDFRELAKKRAKARQQGEPVPPRYELKLLAKSGQTIWADSNARVIEFEGQVAVLGTAFNITDRKQAEVERERLLAAEREQRLLAETLGEVFLALTAQTSHEAVLDEILRQVRRVVSYSAANIMLLEGDILRSVRWQGYQTFGSEEWLANLKQSLADFPLDGRVVQSRQPLLVLDTRQTPDWVAVEEAAWIRSFVAVPICLHERVLGLLRLDSNVPHKFSAQDVEHLQPLVHAAAIAFENARLYDQTRQELAERKQAEKKILELNRKLLALQYAGAAIASSLDISYILNAVTKEMINLLEVESCVLSEWDQLANVVSVMVKHSITDWGDNESSDTVYDLADFPLTKQVLLERHAQQMTINQADIDLAELAYMQAIHIKTLLMLPMEFQNRVVGLVEVMDSRIERAFTIEEVALAQFLANQAATAIENARLYDQARQEIAERAQVEKELRQVATRNQVILDAIPDSMFYLNRQGQLLDYKIVDGHDLLPGVLDKTMIGKNLSDRLHVPPDLVDLTRRHIEQTLVSNRMQVFEYQLSFPFGLQDFEARLVVSSPGEVLAIVRNITERKQAERQTIRAARLAALGRLAATLAHEINNPLQAIQSHLDLILDFPLEPGESEEYLQIIRYEIERLRDIAQDVLNYANPKPAPRQQVFVTELVERVLSLVHKRLEQSGVRVTTDLQTVPPVLAAPNQLSQVFLNLVINATEALPDDGQLNITIYPEQDNVVIAFTNNGPIIPPEILSRIFEPFFTTKPEGSGLGLWVSHSLVQQHAGLLTVENLGEQQGVIFTVKLPAAS